MHKWPENPQKIAVKSPPVHQKASIPTKRQPAKSAERFANNPNNPNKTHAEAQRPQSPHSGFNAPSGP